jgi:DNA mismatch repair protein MutS2
MEPLETLELNNRIRRLEAEERHEVEKVLRLLTALVKTDLPDLEQSFECLARLDGYHAMALVSKRMQQHAPAINENGALKIKNGRHPLLVLKKSASAIPLNIAIGDGYKTLVITGPNAGGKTVALKTVGLLALMTACGLHIPADADSEIPVFQSIFVLVGDAQSIEMDLSTFSAHLEDLKEVVDKGCAGDLVLIDEIGSGTDPQEGAALAMAILETLTSRGILTIVTTHHGSLKAFAHRCPGVANGSMAFDSETLTPTYEFRSHLPGSSYALEIATRLGIPSNIVSRARRLMGSQANKLEGLILDLENQIAHHHVLRKSLEEEKRATENLRERLDSQRLQWEEESRNVRRGAAQEAEAIVKGANAAVEKTIRMIREKGATSESIRAAKRLLHEEKERHKEYRVSEEPHIHDGMTRGGDDIFQPGVHVYWEKGKKKGTVLEGKTHGGTLLIAFGDLKVQVPQKELKVITDGDDKRASGRLQFHVPIPSGIRSEIDLRGMRVEEALPVVDKLLSDAALSGLEEVRLIHGMGTGILRKNIATFLEEHPLVVETTGHDSDPVNPGVTVVRLIPK